MTSSTGTKRLFKTLCNVLDELRAEAPSSASIYHPPKSNGDAVTQARSRALLHLYLKARFGLIGFDERERFVTDGKYDGGIDAYFIDSRNKNIYVLQSKFRATAENFVSSNMDVTDLLKMDVSRVMKGEKKAEDGTNYNDRIVKNFQRDIRKLPDVASYTVRVVLLGNANTFTTQQLRKLVDGYDVEQIPHDKAFEKLLFPVVNGTYFNDPNLTIEISLSNVGGGNSHLDYDVRATSLKCNVKLLFVPTREVGRVMHTYKNSILRYNPRSFLELKKNAVNQDIEDSLISSRNNEFALFNNGLTIVSDGTQISSDTAKQDTAQVVLRNPQLVNGGQTAYTLSRVYESALSKADYSAFKGKEVLVKVITFVGSQGSASKAARESLINAISKASNSQTKVDESDRRSNDDIQFQLQEKFFKEHGLYYERKRGEFSDGIRYKYISPDLLLKRERLVRTALACDYRATQARSSLSKYFEASSFSSLMKVSRVSTYAYAYAVLGLLAEKRKEPPKTRGDRFHSQEFGQALRYGMYAVLAVAANLGVRKKKAENVAMNTVLTQWKAFESWAAKQTSNAAYLKNGILDYVNYYKGSTINSDLQAYAFTM